MLPRADAAAMTCPTWRCSHCCRGPARAGGKISRRRSRHARPRRPYPRRPRARSRSRGARRGRHAQAWRGRGKRHRGFGEPPPRRRAGRAHSRLQGILELAAARRCRDAGAKTRNRNCRRGCARGDRCGRPALAKTAHRRPRHRQRRAHSGTAVRTAERLRRRLPTRVRRRLWWRATMPAVSPRHGQGSSPATWPRRCADRSMRSCPIRLTSPPVTSPRSPRTYATSIRIWRSTAALTDLTSIAPSPRLRPCCWRPAGPWSSSLASARRNRSPIYLLRWGLRRHRRTPTLTVRYAPSLQENGHEREALDPGKKALGAPKKPWGPAKSTWDPGKKALGISAGTD